MLSVSKNRLTDNTYNSLRQDLCAATHDDKKLHEELKAKKYAEAIKEYGEQFKKVIEQRGLKRVQISVKDFVSLAQESCSADLKESDLQEFQKAVHAFYVEKTKR